MTEQLHFHFSLSCVGEGNGNPLQCSCLENPRDGIAWWAAVYGVAQSWTGLKRLSSSSSSSIQIILNNPSQKILNLITPTKSFLPWKVTYSQFQGSGRRWASLGQGSILPTTPWKQNGSIWEEIQLLESQMRLLCGPICSQDP